MEAAWYTITQWTFDSGSNCYIFMGYHIIYTLPEKDILEDIIQLNTNKKIWTMRTLYSHHINVTFFFQRVLYLVYIPDYFELKSVYLVSLPFIKTRLCSNFIFYIIQFLNKYTEYFLIMVFSKEFLVHNYSEICLIKIT